jgi:DNA-binding CsgD family transcriptional regulator
VLVSVRPSARLRHGVADERKKRLVLRLVAVSFFVLAAYVPSKASAAWPPVRNRNTPRWPSCCPVASAARLRRGVYCGLAADGGSHHNAARLFGAADAIRQRLGVARFRVYQAPYDAAIASLRNDLGEQAFDAAWAEGAALSTEEAIAYAQRGRGERKRPTSGWGSLTPTERDVVRLVSEGLANNDIATRLFVSPRTVQTHLTHVYTKLGLTSRVQLVQEAARHT